MFVAYDINSVKQRMAEKANTVMCSIGVLIYAGIGAVSLILGANFLDYGILHTILPAYPAKARALGTLGIEVGVGIAVMSVMVSIFLNIATGGEDEGEAE